MQRKLNRRVLVIEDDNDIRRLITESLRGAGLDVVAAVDASQALRTALARKPAAVVLDIGLPDCEGTARSTSHGDAFPQNVRLTTVHGSKFVGSFVVMQAEETHLFDLRAVPD